MKRAMLWTGSISLYVAFIFAMIAYAAGLNGNLPLLKNVQYALIGSSLVTLLVMFIRLFGGDDEKID